MHNIGTCLEELGIVTRWNHYIHGFALIEDIASWVLYVRFSITQAIVYDSHTAHFLCVCEKGIQPCVLCHRENMAMKECMGA